MTCNGKAWILDVGHGNCSVVKCGDSIAVIDGGRSDTLLRFLEGNDIQKIETILVSHADADHFGGISALLASRRIEVGRVCIAPDQRDSDLWLDFATVMRDAKDNLGTEFCLELNESNPGKIRLGEIMLEVIAPSQELASRSPYGVDESGRQLNPNSVSGVVRIWKGQSPRILLAADIDQVGFDNLSNTRDDLSAEVLVFPHHGGLPGRGNAREFAQEVVAAVDPKVVIFSIGRNYRNTPRPEIVSGIRDSNECVHVACTQLSKQCSANLPANGVTWHNEFSKGRSSKACCAGTIEIGLGNVNSFAPSIEIHTAFVKEYAPTALCRLPQQSLKESHGAQHFSSL